MDIAMPPQIAYGMRAGAQDAHDGSKLLEEIRHATFGERNTMVFPGLVRTGD